MSVAINAEFLNEKLRQFKEDPDSLVEQARDDLIKCYLVARDQVLDPATGFRSAGRNQMQALKELISMIEMILAESETRKSGVSMEEQKMGVPVKGSSHAGRIVDFHGTPE